MAKTAVNGGTRVNGEKCRLAASRWSVVASRLAVVMARTVAFARPCVTGAGRMRRSDCHASSIVPRASSALPRAPAVVPRRLAPSATVARSMMVAARLIPCMTIC